MDVLSFPMGIKVKEKYTVQSFGEIVAYQGDNSWIKILRNNQEYTILKKDYHCYEFFIPEDVTGKKIKFGDNIYKITSWESDNSFICAESIDGKHKTYFSIQRFIIGELSFIKEDNKHLIGKPVIALKDYPYNGFVKKDEIGIITEIDGKSAIADFESQKNYRFPINRDKIKFLEPLKASDVKNGTKFININSTPSAIRTVITNLDFSGDFKYIVPISTLDWKYNFEKEKNNLYLVSLPEKSVLPKEDEPYPVDITYAEGTTHSYACSGMLIAVGEGLTDTSSEIKKDRLRLRLNIKKVEPLKVQETKFKIIKTKIYDIYTKSN